MTTNAKGKINKELNNLPIYWDSVPLDTIFEIVQKYANTVVDEDKNPWDGILCGECGNATFNILDCRFSLRITWYKMGSGKYEIVSYVS